jgi:hypothetical protein
MGAALSLKKEHIAHSAVQPYCESHLPDSDRGPAVYKSRPDGATSQASPHFSNENSDKCRLTDTTKNDPFLQKSEAVSAVGGEKPLPPDLAAVVKAWPALPEAVKAGIVAMVKASRGQA